MDWGRRLFTECGGSEETETAEQSARAAHSKPPASSVHAAWAPSSAGARALSLAGYRSRPVPRVALRGVCLPPVLALLLLRAGLIP